jgi:hypothetical protein
MPWHENISTCVACKHGNAEKKCAGACPCQADPRRRDIIELATAGDCPLKLHAGPGDDSPPPSPPPPNPLAGPPGAKLWAQLHQRALASDLKNEQQWFERFCRQIPCGDCKRHWTQVIARMPPDFSSNASYFAWTVAAHNEVSRKLGKPLMSVAEARGF